MCLPGRHRESQPPSFHRWLRSWSRPKTRRVKVYVHTEEGKVKAEVVLARYPFAFAVSLDDATVSSRNASSPECTSEKFT